MRNNILDKHLSGMNLTSDSRLKSSCRTSTHPVHKEPYSTKSRYGEYHQDTVYVHVEYTHPHNHTVYAIGNCRLVVE